MFKLVGFTSNFQKNAFRVNLLTSQLSKRCFMNCRKVQFLQENRYLRDSAKKINKITFIDQCKFIHLSITNFDEYKVVQVPQFAESVSEGDIRWEKAVGDSVEIDEVIGEIETDKTSIPINSPVSGVIEELIVEDGETIKPGQEIVKIKICAASSSAATKKVDSEKPKVESLEKPESLSEHSSKIEKTSDSSFKLDNSQSKLNTENDSLPKTKPPIPSKPTSPIESKDISGAFKKKNVENVEFVPKTETRSENRVKINRMRNRIAQRLKDAQNTYAMLTTFNEIDMSNAIEMRNLHKDAFLKKHNLKLGFMSTFVAASVFALKDQPVVNAVIDDQEIIYRDYIDISVAVASPKGLVVPVIRNCENLNYAQIEKTIHGLGEKARNNLLAIEDMDGGTFTISNGGVFGSLMGTPIINPPQSAILGMHSIIERPVVINKQIVIRPMMYVALTYDHRLIDGREAVTFLRKIKAAVEDPRILHLDL